MIMIKIIICIIMFTVVLCLNYQILKAIRHHHLEEVTVVTIPGKGRYQEIVCVLSPIQLLFTRHHIKDGDDPIAIEDYDEFCEQFNNL